jgi:hypothetical protein
VGSASGPASPVFTVASSISAIIGTGSGAPRHPGVTFLSAVLGAAFIGLFHANAVGSTGPAFIMEASALTNRDAMRAYLSGQNIVLAAIGIPLLIEPTFGLAAVGGFPAFGFETMPVGLAALGAGHLAVDAPVAPAQIVSCHQRPHGLPSPGRPGTRRG